MTSVTDRRRPSVNAAPPSISFVM